MSFAIGTAAHIQQTDVVSGSARSAGVGDLVHRARPRRMIAFGFLTRQTLIACAVGADQIQLRLARAARHIHDLRAAWRPGRRDVAGVARRQLSQVGAVTIDDVDVVVLRVVRFDENASRVPSGDHAACALCISSVPPAGRVGLATS